MILSEYYENLSFNHGLMVNISYAGIPTDFPLHWHTFVEIMISFDGSFIQTYADADHARLRIRRTDTFDEGYFYAYERCILF